MSRQQEKPSYTFTPKIPSLQAIPDSAGDIKNFTAPIYVPGIKVPGRTGKDKPGEKIVDLALPSKVDEPSFLYVHLSEHSDECRKIYCILGDSDTGAGGGGGGEPYSSGGGGHSHTSQDDEGTSDYPPNPPNPDEPTQKQPYEPTQKQPYEPTQKQPYEPTQKQPYEPTQKPDYSEDIPKPPREGTCKFYPKDPSGDPTKGGHWYYPDPDPKKGGEWIYQPPQEKTPEKEVYPSPTTTPTTAEEGLNLENDLIVIGKSLMKKLGNVKTLKFLNEKDNEVIVQVIAGYDLNV